MMDRLQEALTTCEDQLESLGKRRDAWKLLNVHVHNGQLSGIGWSVSAESVLGPTLTPVTGDVRDHGDLPVLLEILNSEDIRRLTDEIGRLEKKVTAVIEEIRHQSAAAAGVVEGMYLARFFASGPAIDGVESLPSGSFDEDVEYDVEHARRLITDLNEARDQHAKIFSEELRKPEVRQRIAVEADELDHVQDPSLAWQFAKAAALLAAAVKDAALSFDALRSYVQAVEARKLHEKLQSPKRAKAIRDKSFAEMRSQGGRRTKKHPATKIVQIAVEYLRENGAEVNVKAVLDCLESPPEEVKDRLDQEGVVVLNDSPVAKFDEEFQEVTFLLSEKFLLQKTMTLKRLQNLVSLFKKMP